MTNQCAALTRGRPLKWVWPKTSVITRPTRWTGWSKRFSCVGPPERMKRNSTPTR